MDFIEDVIGLIFSVFIFLLMFRVWKVLGLLMSVLNLFLARHGTLWDALDAIRKQRNRERLSERQ